MARPWDIYFTRQWVAKSRIWSSSISVIYSISAFHQSHNPPPGYAAFRMGMYYSIGKTPVRKSEHGRLVNIFILTASDMCPEIVKLPLDNISDLQCRIMCGREYQTLDIALSGRSRKSMTELLRRIIRQYFDEGIRSAHYITVGDEHKAWVKGLLPNEAAVDNQHATWLIRPCLDTCCPWQQSSP